MLKKKFVIFICLLVTFLTGCWDRIDIENRGFIFAIGIDKYDPSDLNKYETKKYIEKQQQKFSPEQQKPNIKTNDLGIDPNTKRKVKPPLPKSGTLDKFTITIVIPNTSQLAQKGGGGGGSTGGMDQPPRFLFSVPSKSVYTAKFKFQDTLEKQLNYGYTKLVILGRDLCYEPKLVKEAVDAVMRSKEFSRNRFICVSETTARDILNTIPLTLPITGMYIAQIIKNAKYVGRTIDSTIGEVSKSFSNSGCAVISRVEPDIDKLHVSGAAILKDYRLVGWINEEHVIVYKMFKNRLRQTVIDDVGYKGYYIPFNIQQAITKYKLIADKKGIRVVFKPRIEGSVLEFIHDSKEIVLDKKVSQIIQKGVADWIKLRTNEMVILSKKYKCDFIGVGDLLSKHKPKIWKKVEKNWEKEYQKVIIEVEPVVYLRRSGILK